MTRAPSVELRPDQTDQDSLPPCEVLDAIMQAYMEENQNAVEIIDAGYRKEDVARITHLIKINEYKRRQSPVVYASRIAHSVGTGVIQLHPNIANDGKINKMHERRPVTA